MSHLDQQTVRNRLLAALSPADFALLRSSLERRSVAVGEVLIEADMPIGHVYFPESGLTCLVSRSAAQTEVGVVGREGMVGSSVLLDVDRVPLTASGQIAGEGYSLSSAVLVRALDSSRSLRRLLARYTHTVMMQAASTVYANAHFTVEQRLARWLLMVRDRLGQDDMDLTHEFLAKMLCVRRPGVTVATHLIEGVGAIRARRGRITVVNRETLMAIAGDSYGLAEAEYERVMRPDGVVPDLRRAA